LLRLESRSDVLALLPLLWSRLPLGSSHCCKGKAEIVIEFSVIIPTHSRPEKLRLCLASLCELDFPKENFEVIVVDDGSPESLGALVQTFSGPLQLTLIRQENCGPAGARNRGARDAKGRFLVFTDDDCKADRRWLRELASKLHSENQVLTGCVVNALSENPFSAASQELVHILHFHFKVSGRKSFLTSNNFAISKAAFKKLNGFDGEHFKTAAAEDRDFAERSVESGYELVYVPEAIVLHAHDLGLGSFLRQHFNYGRGAYWYHHQRKQRTGLSFEPDLSLTLKIVSARLPKPTLTALLTLSQLANAAGYFYERLRSLFVRAP
jgi:GT2 family glycosyltransferase